MQRVNPVCQEPAVMTAGMTFVVLEEEQPVPQNIILKKSIKICSQETNRVCGDIALGWRFGESLSSQSEVLLHRQISPSLEITLFSVIISVSIRV